MEKTQGFQQLDHLNDKSSLFLLMLEKEAETLSDLRESVTALRDKKAAIKKSNSELESRINKLVAKRSEMDEKAGVLLKFLDDVPIS
jgi:predicted  nucleic acid-binding Zn-ribbon protein